jgi:integrase
MGTTRFELRKDKMDKQGQAPIRLIYQISGQRKFYSSGLKIYAENWDEAGQKAMFVKKGKLLDLEVRQLNNKLSDILRDLEKIEQRFEANGIVYSCEMVIEALLNIEKPIIKKDASSKELLGFIDKYIKDHENLRVKGSLSVYKSFKTHLSAYEQATRKPVSFDRIEHQFFQSFQNFLVGLTKEVEGKRAKALNNITIAKQLSTLKTFLNYARTAGIEVNPRYTSFKVKRESELEVISLTRSEFEALYNLDLRANKAQSQVRDVFCFSCVTGLRYSDLAQLKWEHIHNGCINLVAKKTSHRTSIPLNPYSEAILKKYEGEPRPGPVISNQKSNEHMEKICKAAGIDTPVEIVRKHGAERVVKVYPKYELIRMHAGRKTFASLSLEAGMPAEQVMKIGGWKDYKSFKRYMNLSDSSTQGAMLAAWGGKLITTKLKAV